MSVRCASSAKLLPDPNEPTYPRKFDLLILDEAHNVAPAGRGRYATDSLRTLAIRTLAPHFGHRLFLSAPSHNGYPESFTALLELLDPQRFARGVTPDRNSLAAVMVRRLKSELPPRWDGTPRFPERKLEAIEVLYPAEELQIHRLLRAYTRSRLRGSVDPTEQVASEFVLKLLKKRLFSSPEAFARTLAQHEESLRSARRASGNPSRHSVGILRSQLEYLDEEFGDDEAADTALDATLATDAASEGIDLQNHCAKLIHMEIPWNPNRMEQRNGRIDRHGQRAPEVLIYHFVSRGWRERQLHDSLAPNELAADLEFLLRAAQKVNTIREDSGRLGR